MSISCRRRRRRLNPTKPVSCTVRPGGREGGSRFPDTHAAEAARSLAASLAGLAKERTDQSVRRLASFLE